MSYYVYAYLREKNSNVAKAGTPYYIGKGKGNRAYARHTVPCPTDKSLIVFLETNLTEIGALALERRYIEWYGRVDTCTGILRNMTDGGESVSGRCVTEESRRKSQKSNQETWTKKDVLSKHRDSMLPVWTDPVRNDKIRKSNLGENNPMYGKPAPNRGKQHSERTRQKMKDYWARRRSDVVE